MAAYKSLSVEQPVGLLSLSLLFLGDLFNEGGNFIPKKSLNNSLSTSLLSRESWERD